MLLGGCGSKRNDSAVHYPTCGAARQSGSSASASASASCRSILRRKRSSKGVIGWTESARRKPHNYRDFYLIVVSGRADLEEHNIGITVRDDFHELSSVSKCSFGEPRRDAGEASGYHFAG